MLLEGIRWAVSWFAGYLVLHIGASRVVRPQRYVACAFRLFLIGAAALAIVSARALPLGGVAWFNALLIFSSLWVFYMIITVNVMRSVSVRTLVELARSPSHALGVEALDRLYDTRTMFEHRIDSLVMNGCLEPVNHHYRLTSRGRGIARLGRWARRVLSLRTYG